MKTACTPPIRSFNSISVIYKTDITSPIKSRVCVISKPKKLVNGWTINADMWPPDLVINSDPALIGIGSEWIREWKAAEEIICTQKVPIKTFCDFRNY